jgi:ribosomal protein S6--L-glutamate ligase
MGKKAISLEGRLRHCRNVITLGVKPNFSDYSVEEQRLMRQAPKIYYPSTFYADLFDAAGKPLFPSYHTYKCVQDKIKQTALFELLDIPHPRTRVFYSRSPKGAILDRFQYPFVAKIARGSAMGQGVFLIADEAGLDSYLSIAGPAYVQEYLPADRDMRVVVIGTTIAHAYWRIARPGEFRSNVSMGATIGLDPLPTAALDLALETARRCRFDDVGIDIRAQGDRYVVIEANMKYGKEGFRAAGIDYGRMMEKLIENEEI